MTIRPRIEAFVVQKPPFELVPSPPLRQWMDEFDDRHPYRCLPLSIANTHGWDVLCPGDVEITWNGGPKTSDLTVKNVGPLPEGVTTDHFLRSHFSRAVFTFHTSFMFRTPPGWSILVSGPFNRPKNGAFPLTGVVETDWLPYPFTMNWLATAPGTIRFEKGEPICTIMPIPKNYLEGWDIAIHDMTDDPVMCAEHETFRIERSNFQKRLDEKDPEAQKQAWQRHYFVGRHPDGTSVDDHANKVRLATPFDARGTKPIYSKDEPATEAAKKILAQMKDPASVKITGCPVDHTAMTKKPASKFWSETSILNDINQGQTERNYAGRKRINDGILTRSKNTFEITGSVDPSSLDFVCVPNFLSPKQCKLLIDTSRDLSNLQAVKGVKDQYWSGRVLYITDILKNRPEAAEVMRQAQIGVTEKLREFYELKAPVYADTVHIVQWKEGLFMQPHADRANPDGSPHDFPYRDFASIIYLNDDYDGGEVYFNGLDIVLKPKAGMLVAFTGGWYHEHAVLKVTKGTRLTMPAFYTFDETKKDKTLYK